MKIKETKLSTEVKTQKAQQMTTQMTFINKNKSKIKL